MDAAISGQVLIFFQSIVLGVIIGVFYEIFRIIRMAHENGRILIFFEDIIFFSVSSVVTFLFILTVNQGQIRFYIILGEIIGLTTYFLTMGVVVNKIFKLIIKMLKKILYFIYYITIRPIKLLVQFICKKIKASIERKKIKINKRKEEKIKNKKDKKADSNKKNNIIRRIIRGSKNKTDKKRRASRKKIIKSKINRKDA